MQIFMNYFVHTIMYGYFSLRAMQFTIPKWVNQMITSLQIIQMFLGTYVILGALYQLVAGPAGHCHCTMNGTLTGLAMYVLYIYFFCKFFVDTYLRRKTSRQANANGKTTNGDLHLLKSKMYSTVNGSGDMNNNMNKLD